jgi:Superinfection exclusion gene product 17
MKKLRVYWHPQVPCPAFHVDVKSLREARLIMNALADYDIFQYENRIKPDYCNAGGLSEFDPEDDHDGPDGSWCDWHDPEFDDDFRDISDERIAELDAEAMAELPDYK